jgi:hypothetical protein
LFGGGVAGLALHVRQEKPWAQFAVKKNPTKTKGAVAPEGLDKKKPIGDRCLEHHEFYENNLAGTYEWLEACSRKRKDATFAGDLQNGKGIEAGELARSFEAADLGVQLHVGIKVADHGFFLTKTEFVTYSGGFTPEQCRVSPVTAMNSKGQSCRGYPASDPDKPYRTFTAFACSCDYKSAVTLAAAKNVLPTMSKDHKAKLHRDRVGSKELPNDILGRKLYTPLELKERELRSMPPKIP